MLFLVGNWVAEKNLLVDWVSPQVFLLLILFVFFVKPFQLLKFLPLLLVEINWSVEGWYYTSNPTCIAIALYPFHLYPFEPFLLVFLEFFGIL
jgi:hypothetical protein